jgi:hypothetical protein
MSVALAVPASAKVLTVCGGSPILDAPSRAEIPARPFAALAYAAPGALVKAARIALTQDEAGYDIHRDWSEEGGHSLRQAGAQILSLGLDSGIVHLMVARSDVAPIEHYLFQLDASGDGELLSGQDTDEGLARFSCTAP